MGLWRKHELQENQNLTLLTFGKSLPHVKYRESDTFWKESPQEGVEYQNLFTVGREEPQYDVFYEDKSVN